MMLLDSRDSLGNVTINPGIDIRAAVEQYFFGSSAVHGIYAIYRRYDTSALTDYWDEEKQEAIGGPKYEYSDEIIKVRFSWSARGIGIEEQTGLGEMAFKKPFCHMKYTTTPKIEDCIFAMTSQPSDGYSHIILPVDYAIQYDIVQVIPYRNQDGRVEFYTCILNEETKR